MIGISFAHLHHESIQIIHPTASTLRRNAIEGSCSTEKYAPFNTHSRGDYPWFREAVIVRFGSKPCLGPIMTTASAWRTWLQTYPVRLPNIESISLKKHPRSNSRWNPCMFPGNLDPTRKANTGSCSMIGVSFHYLDLESIPTRPKNSKDISCINHLKGGRLQVRTFISIAKTDQNGHGRAPDPDYGFLIP